MTKLDKNSLQALREKLLKEKNEKIILRVGLGTCGIAAGAEDTIRALEEELQKQNISHYEIQRTGCMGFCYCEPNVEVIMPGMPAVIYGEVNEEIAKKIVIKHLIHKKLVNGHVYEQPTVDLIEGQ